MIVRTLARGAAALALSGAAATAATALAADRPDFGKREYEANCALCHGADGRSGAYVEFLKVTPPDLAQLARLLDAAGLRRSSGSDAPRLQGYTTASVESLATAFAGLLDLQPPVTHLSV